MSKKPKRKDVQVAKETLKRWYHHAKSRNKYSAMDETKRIFEMLEYFESVTDFNNFE